MTCNHHLAAKKMFRRLWVALGANWDGVDGVVFLGHKFFSTCGFDWLAFPCSSLHGDADCYSELPYLYERLILLRLVQNTAIPIPIVSIPVSILLVSWTSLILLHLCMARHRGGWTVQDIISQSIISIKGYSYYLVEGWKSRFRVVCVVVSKFAKSDFVDTFLLWNLSKLRKQSMKVCVRTSLFTSNSKLFCSILFHSKVIWVTFSI